MDTFLKALELKGRFMETVSIWQSICLDLGRDLVQAVREVRGFPGGEAHLPPDQEAGRVPDTQGPTVPVQRKWQSSEGLPIQQNLLCRVQTSSQGR